MPRRLRGPPPPPPHHGPAVLSRRPTNGAPAYLGPPVLTPGAGPVPPSWNGGTGPVLIVGAFLAGGALTWPNASGPAFQAQSWPAGRARPRSVDGGLGPVIRRHQNVPFHLLYRHGPVLMSLYGCRPYPAWLATWRRCSSTPRAWPCRSPVARLGPVSVPTSWQRPVRQVKKAWPRHPERKRAHHPRMAVIFVPFLPCTFSAPHWK